MIRTLLPLVLLAFVSPASGSNPESFLTPEGHWPRERVSDHVSEVGEPLAAFLRREVAPALATFTKERKVEACGVIGFDGQRFSVRLGTDGVQQGCAMPKSDLVEGAEWTGETIHSHPPGLMLRLTLRDRAWARHFKVGNHVVTELPNDGRDGFSQTDFHGGAGWLVAGGKLWHQRGKGTVRQHGHIEP